MTTIETAATRVLLIEDHTLVRQSLAKIVEQTPGFEVVGEAGDPDEGAVAVATQRPDIVVLDVSLPGSGGIELAIRLKRERPQLRVMFLTMHDDDATVVRALAAGADGYVLKSASTNELIHALQAVASGGSYLSPSIARRVLNRTHSRDSAELTDRELEIIRLLAHGIRPAEVAARLFVSVRTVRNHLASIYVKLDVSSATQAVAEAFRHGLVAAPSRASL